MDHLGEVFLARQRRIAAGLADEGEANKRERDSALDELAGTRVLIKGLERMLREAWGADFRSHPEFEGVVDEVLSGEITLGELASSGRLSPGCDPGAAS